MSISPASLHRVTVQANREAAQAADNETATPEQRSQYNQHLMRLAQDKRRLKKIKSITRKIEIKREIIPDYLPYVEAVLEAGTSKQDDVLVYVMLWSLDAGDYERGLDLAAFAIQNDMVLGADFARDLPDVVVEEMANRVMQHETPASLISMIQRVHELVHEVDLHDEVSAKLHKAMGMCLEASEPRKALHAYETARQLNPKLSVTRIINRLKKELGLNP